MGGGSGDTRKNTAALPRHAGMELERQRLYATKIDERCQG